MTIFHFQTFKIHLCEFVWRKMNKYEKVEDFEVLLPGSPVSENRAVPAETVRQILHNFFV